jgi:glutamate carboxypeptidase
MMDGHGPNLLNLLTPRREDMLADLASLIEHESPSRDKAALDGLAHVLGARLKAHGATVEPIANPTGGDHLRALFHFGPVLPGEILPALVLCHFDTVWPLGTLEAMPFRVENNRAYGPGIYDMKASLVLLEYAIGAIRSLGLTPPRPIVALLTSDEEIGSPDSRSLIEAEASRSAHVLVLEAPLTGGRLKTARKGVGNFQVSIQGRAAHAGVEPEKGVNAIVELAHQILAIQDLARPELGTTLNVGLVQGGTATNVVPAAATARLDVRVATLDEAQRVETALGRLTPRLPGGTIAVSGKFNRPPMERTPAIAALFERVRTLGRTLNLELEEGATGGASDGNFTAALGVPTIDGLGALGAGAHSKEEHVLIDSLPIRAALLATLLLEL